ncbi:MFS transporter [Sphingomonas rhizophila]|uniref:MFS transporter n=1 Tax=Sphingomonas rhizophila TaxID=2071607 RepID=A0A7G9SBY8_9SPHN|nr:MFS transporter [Sphingomonas rhizophila]QNN65363.1 MFS transporter [Sphingomonas rhizophila]
MSETAKPWSMTRVVTASSAGTAFEWYDFFIFGSLTPIISKVFFAGLDPTAALVAALALFAVGFAFRPLGAIIFGAMGDRVGRKATFLATVSLMGGATFAIGLLPTYAQAGVIAPILLIILRICQGTALGGEYGGAAIYVAEHAEDHHRGASTGWIQSSASFGLLAALLVIFATRRAVGAEAFDAWGWRIPFLVSVILLAISVWMRVKLSESPAFAKLRDEGQVSKAPLREAFADRENLKRVAIAFFAIMCAQGAVWYFTFFYMQVFLEKSLGIPGATKDLLLIIMTIVSAPLYVVFGKLSDRWGRKPVMLFGMLLALVLYFPGSHWIANAANPALVEAQRATPVTVVADPSTCSAQFDPTGTRRFDSACDIAKSLLVARGINYNSVDSSDPTGAVIAVGNQRIALTNGQTLSDAELKTAKADLGNALKESLTAAGYPASADPARMNWPVLVGVLLLFVVAATALYGPQAAALVEMFPTRVRYSAMSLPYHFGTGWVGGFLPFTSFAIVALTGDIYAGLWYSVIFTLISVLTTIFFLKETAGKPLD